MSSTTQVSPIRGSSKSIKAQRTLREKSLLSLIAIVEFSVSKPCSRCSFINVDPKTGNSDADEPLRTLSKFRYYRGNLDFGQNLILLNSGLLSAGIRPL